MSGISSIGIQIITPKTGTTPEQYQTPQSNTRDNDNDETPRQAALPPGTGKLLDKTV
ncbi:MAG TPA: hypothetical protein VG986_07915 [Pseudolabrys sp.]|jgi:hypothetical protein|nr:hypothetical protein [Pseudolabrys sp.]